ncbi:biotin transporter BioY [bacterium]|nr:MAG: biotin transporter BioY [bacterium]
MAVQPAVVRHPGVLADLIPGTWVRDAALVAGYAALVGLSAQIVIRLPFTPVPITGQTFGVLLGAMVLGWRRGLLGMVVYTLVGLAGLPWFAGATGGANAIFLPSFGYIVGFIGAAAVIGRLAGLGLDRTPWGALGAMIAGNVVVYAAGATWLAFAIHVGPATALALGVTPFLLGDALKALIAAGLLPGIWMIAGRR